MKALNLKSIQQKKKKLFSKMTIVEKRIAIAKDVIFRIRMKQFVPTKGSFVSIDDFNIIQSSGEENEICDIVNSKKKCNVCAKGGLFMSLIGYVDNFIVGDMSGSASSQSKLHNKEMRTLSKIFPKKQLSLIETTFEGETFGWNLELSNSEKEKCFDFYKKFHFSYDRLLLAICKNIVKNKGTFKP